MMGMANALGLKAVECAERSIGVTEETPNWGRWVRVYLAFIGLFQPAPWCAAFVAYKVHQGARECGETAKWPKTGYVQSVYVWAKRRGLVEALPHPGAAFVVYSPGLRRYAHIGFIAEVEARGRDGLWFRSVEGNSNRDGGREGTSVVSRWRRWHPRMAAIGIR